MPDTDEDILQAAAIPVCIMHVVGRDNRQFEFAGK